MNRKHGRPPVFAVSGVKNSGKTTLLENLIGVLSGRGWKVAAVKHDGHDFEPDVPGTDSHRLRKAGARGVAVYSVDKLMLVEERPNPSLDDLLELFAAYDLVLLEGGKHTPFPKLEIVRAAVSRVPVCDPETLIGLCTDCPLSLPGIVCFGLTDYEKMADLLEARLLDKPASE